DGRLADDGRRHHEDDQQHEGDVDQGRDVDPVDPVLVLRLRQSRHGYATSRFACMPAATACARAWDRPVTRFRSRWKTLKASTAGIATKRPTAVATSASEMPAITTEAAPPAPLPVTARSAKARMIPRTVPNRPTKGALFPSVPRMKSPCSYSRRRFSIKEAIDLETVSNPKGLRRAAVRTTSASMASPVAIRAASSRLPACARSRS